MENEPQMSQQSEVVENEFVYLLDGYTLTPSYLFKGSKKSHTLYIHHYAMEILPQISKPTDINISEIYNKHLPVIEEETKVLSSFKTRSILLLKMNSICRGTTPVQKETFELLKKLYENDILPVIPEKTERNNCGNTYHIAAVGRVLIGEGQVVYNNERKETKDVFAELNIEPIKMQDPEYKIFVEGNEYNVLKAIDSYDKVYRYFQTLALSISLALFANGKIPKTIEKSFFNQYTMKGISRIVNLIRNFIPEREQKEEQEIKGIHDMETDPIIVDFICSFGRIMELLLFVKEMIPMEMNSTRDQYFVNQRREDVGVASPSWGIGSYSGVITREIVSIAKELVCLSKRYETLLKNPIDIKLEDEKNETVEKDITISPFEHAFDKIKKLLHIAHQYVTAYLKQATLLEYPSSEIPTQQQLIDELKQIEEEKLPNAIKFGDVVKIMKSTHFDF